MTVPPKPRRVAAAIGAALLVLGAGLSPASADATFTVTSTDDVDNGSCTAEHCSLREAILAANATAGTDLIDFALPGDPPYVISPAAALPAVTQAVTIDATQPGYAGTPVVRLDGSLAGAGTNGLILSGSGITVAGLAVVRFTGNGVRITGPGNTLRSSAIGTDGEGTAGLGNTANGVFVSGSGNTVGGPDPGAGNRIAGNGTSGVRTAIQASGTVVQGNRIEKNTGIGVVVVGGAGHAIRSNAIAGNGGLGIDLAPLGPTPNDPGDGDSGVNGLQNYPVITSAAHDQETATTIVDGTLSSTASSSFTVELFAGAACDPSGNGEGEVPLTTIPVTTTPGGVGSFSVEVPDPALPVGAFVTSTATTGGGSTSELSACRAVVEADDPPPPPPPGDVENFVIVLTDDQVIDSFPHEPAVMPYLQAAVNDPGDEWVRFENAFVNTALCCPARASILTGLYSHHHGVTKNGNARQLDDAKTLATWLDAAGYETSLVGKYLNGYPFKSGHPIPPGWDDWHAFEDQRDPALLYRDFLLNENGTAVTYDNGEYSTDVLRDRAVEFLESVPADNNFFLYFSPNAPHKPAIPAPRHDGTFSTLPPTHFPNFNEPDVSDKPVWVRNKARLSAGNIASKDALRTDMFESLLAVDEAIEAIVDTLDAKGVLEETAIVVLSDQGIALGEHKLTDKRCPYDVCIRTPLAIRFPGATPHTESLLASNVDVAPTIADLADVTPSPAADGVSLVPLLTGTATTWRDEVLIEWAGDGTITPPYWGLRTMDYAYFELSTGEVELYDMAGVLGPADPYQLQNVCPGAVAPCTGAYEAVRVELSARLAQLKAD
jgi:N-acetylglucosamine-6-sulfatase